MANETTLALITSMIDPIREAALWYASHTFVMPRLITNFTDRVGFANRTTSEYAEGGAPVELAETDDLTPMAFERQALNTLTPKEYGKQYVITDRRIETDPENVWVDAVKDIGYTIGKKLEIDLLTNFNQLTGGVYGSENSRMSLGKLVAARARLDKAGIPGPYVAVLDTYQYLDLWADWTDLKAPAPLSIRELAMQAYTVTQVADFVVVVSSLVPRNAVQNEKQTITISGSPTGGNFKLAFGEQPTGNIAYNANAAAIEAALEALPNIGEGNVEVSGAGPFTVEFTGDLAGENVPEMTLYANALTGGTAPTVELDTVQEGKNYARGALFAKPAMAVDLRRAMRIEPERDASQRWTELNATIVYASGKWRPEYGVQLKSDASMPLEDVYGELAEEEEE